MEIQDFLALLQNVKGAHGQYTARCPAHEDRTNSLSIGTGADGRILVHCHAGCSHQLILDKLELCTSDLFISLVDSKSVRGETNLQKCKNSSMSSSFKETVYLYTTKENEPLFEVVRRQYPDGTKKFIQRRRVKGRLVYNMDGIEPVLYKMYHLHNKIIAGNTIVFLCEGEKDADRLFSLGLCSTTAPMGAGKWRANYTQALQDAAKVYILPDNDAPGRTHALKVATSLQDAGIDVAIVDLKKLYPGLPLKGDVSDVLDFFGDIDIQKIQELFFANALRYKAFWELTQERDVEDKYPPYQFFSAADYLKTDFLKDLENSKQSQGICTGFPLLDEQFSGHMYPGLYIVGSISSLGKTAFCLQIADSIAAHGRDVLFFTLEMSSMEMVARSLTRILFLQSQGTANFSMGDVLYGHIPHADLKKAQNEYVRTAASHISFIESDGKVGVREICAAALHHAQTTGKGPVVVVDYLQIIHSPDVRMGDKQTMDQAVVALKRLSRQLSAPVIAVSSFNRQNYSEEVNLASFKESGAIEYSADFVMGLQARGVSAGGNATMDQRKMARLVIDTTKYAKQQEPRPLEAVTLKNRRGPAWACFGLDFYPRQNFFIETTL